MPLIAAGIVTLQDAVGKQKTKKYGEEQKKERSIQKKSPKEITHSFKQEVPLRPLLTKLLKRSP
jgi:hypothetical protein